jgi:hypothetical protein
VLLEKPLGVQQFKNFPAFYVTRKFITVLKKSPPRVLNLSKINPIHEMVGSSWVAAQLVVPEEGLSSVSKQISK